MQPQQSSRIDLGDLKAQIVKKLGADRSKWYFYHLNRLLSQNLSKTIFDKLCLRLLGKENLQLHNQFILSILKNACQAKTAPPLHASSQSKPVAEPSGPGFSARSLPVWSNGVLPVSPRKGKSGIRDRKLKDRHRLLGENGKVDDDGGGDKAVLSNGDHRRPLQQLEAAQRRSSPILAPLGIPFCSATRKGLSFCSRVDSLSFCSNNELLCDEENLRRRMDLIVKAQGLEGVSSECAVLLNNMLNLYLKRMIGSAIELVGGRSGSDELKSQLALKPHLQKKASWCPVSLLDFKIAMELNPKQLGEDWPVMLEKICTLTFEE